MNDAEASDFFAGFEVPSAFYRHTLTQGKTASEWLAQTQLKRARL
jgi:hypothetical protein